MRTAMVSLLLLAACGAEPEVTTATLHAAETLSNGASADAILGQMTERGMTATRTDAGGFGSVTGVAIGLASDQLFVADAANKRVLGYSNAAALTDGDPASIVINQQDFATTDFRNVPAVQQITPAGVALDPEDRLYVYSSAHVLVYDNPFSYDKVADFELLGEPANIQSVRALENNKLAVVGINEIAFYERGAPEPYAQAGFAAPCLNAAYDITEDGGIYFVACSGGLLCSDGISMCSGIAVYEIDSVTGFAERDAGTGLPTPYVAYTNLAGARSVAAASNLLLVADTAGHRILRFGNPATHALTVIGGGLPSTPADALTTYGQPDGVTTPVPNYHSSGTPQVSNQGLSSPTFLAISPSDRRMWVADYGNNRVTVYTDVAGTNPVRNAQLVLGQPDSVHAFPNRLEPDSFAAVAGVAIGPGSSGLPRAAVVDTNSHRVLLYDDIGGAITGAGTSHVLGQDAAIDYLANIGSLTPPAPDGLSSPTHVAIGPSSDWLWVTDAGNNRVLTFETPATGANADRAFGAAGVNSAGVYGGFSAIAVSSDHLFVAAGNRVFMYAIASPGLKPIRVFGQDQPPAGTPTTDDIGNAANRGVGPRADTLNNVAGLALDSAGRLWVADRGNHRVLWFNDPSSTTDALTDIVTADGVVGQPDFINNTARMGTGTVNRHSFAGVSDVAVTSDGTLWVTDSTDSRVLAFFTPTQVDPTLGVPRADLVLGQDRFTASGANNATNGINARTLNAPFSVAADSTGRVLVISDRGNNRVVRFVDNLPPEISGAGTFEVERGETRVVMVTITDEEGNTIDVAPVDPYVGAVSGPPPLSVPVTFTAPEDAPVGSDTVVNVVATDRGPRPQRTTFSVVFHIVDRPTEPATGTPETPRPMLDPDTGCVCASGAAAIPWWAALVVLRRRRRG